jgi:adenylate cyclase
MFRSVRGKLFALVALTGGSALVALGVLAWLMQRQLTDLVDARMPAAIEGLRVELHDDLEDAEAMAHTLDASGAVRAALEQGNRAPLLEKLNASHAHHPHVGLAVFAADGSLMAALGLERAPDRLAGIEGLPALAPGEDAVARGVAPHGCEPAEAGAPPAHVVLRRIGELGVVLACLPLDDPLMQHAAAKLAVHLAVLEPGTRRVVASTEGFPVEVVHGSRRSLSLLPNGQGRTWAVERVDMGEVLDAKRVDFVAALDVTEVRELVLRDLAAAAGVVALLSLLAMILGGRMARSLAGAVSSLAAAMRRLQEGEYAHVNDVRTGDELEALADGYNAMVDGLRERDNLRTTFGKYMTRTVMEHLLAGKVELGGESLPVTVLFTDIRSFSTISEHMEAHALVSLLNEYFAEMVTIIMQEDGVVDKFIGDAIMAVFGAPVPKADDAERAVRAAVRMREALATLNEKLVERGTPPIRAGIGIHTGEVVAGNIGSEARMEYTVIGDAVNVASRLETATKDTGEDILVSEDTRAQVGEAFDFRPLGDIQVKGRQQPVRIYGVGTPA